MHMVFCMYLSLLTFLLYQAGYSHISDLCVPRVPYDSMPWQRPADKTTCAPRPRLALGCC